MILALVALAVLFLALLWQVQTGGPFVMLDGMVNAALRPFRAPLPISGFAWLAQFGTGGAGVAAALVASGLLWSDGRVRLILPLWISYFGAQATTWPLKFITARVRPPFLEGVTAASPSFPSAHATVSTVVYGFISLHYLSDVLAGGAVGAFWLILGWRLAAM
jgi:membrane-associated phospholipid phosphatase